VNRSQETSVQPVPAAPERTPAPATGLRPVPSAFAIPAAKPLRVTWPLDIGEEAECRRCLRARQGVNEIQNPGEGCALYVFRITQPGRYQIGRAHV
jgi:hypothetical protein